MTRRSLLRFENFCVKSSSSAQSAKCTFLTSQFPGGISNSRKGHADGSCVIHVGPFHHSVDVDRVVGSTSREMRSAGFCREGTCCHLADEVSCSIKATLLPTKVCHRLDGPLSQYKTINESVYKYEAWIMLLRADVTRLNNLAKSAAAHNSNLGIINFLRGATFEDEHNKWQDVMLSWSFDLIYMHAPYACSLLSQNPCSWTFTGWSTMTFLGMEICDNLGMFWRRLFHSSWYCGYSCSAQSKLFCHSSAETSCGQ
jgi:hypothetical protein